MTDPQFPPVSSLLDRLIPPAVLALVGYVGLWALARVEVVPLAPGTAGWLGLGGGLLLGILLERLPGSRDGESGSLPGAGPQGPFEGDSDGGGDGGD